MSVTMCAIYSEQRALIFLQSLSSIVDGF